MTTKNFRVRHGLTIAGDTSGSTSLAASATGSDIAYTLPTGYPASNGYVLASQTDGTMSWVDGGTPFDQSLNTTDSPTFVDLTLNGELILNGTTSGNVHLTAPAIAGSSQLTLPAAVDVLVARNTTDTLTNKTISGVDNTITGIGNTSLVNSSLTIGTTTIGLGDTSLTLGGLTTVTLTQDPVTALEAATKQYVDTKASTGLTYHEPVHLASTADLGPVIYNQPGGAGVGVGATLTNNNTLQRLKLDNSNVTDGDRVLIKDETNQTYNGVYTVTHQGSGSVAWVLTRATDADTYGSAPNQLSLNDYFFVQTGQTQKGNSYVLNAPVGTITFGTSNITFAEFSSSQVYTATAPIDITGTVISLTTVPITLGGTGETTANAALNALLPTQSGNAGRVLYTDGTNTSWTDFADGFTAGNITIGVDTDNTISTSAGDLAITSDTGLIGITGNTTLTGTLGVTSSLTADSITTDTTLQLNGSTSGSVSFAAPAIAGTQSYTLPTAYPASTGYVLSSTTGGTLSWINSSSVNTTYTQNFSSTTGGTNLNLVGSDSTTDTVKFADGTGVTVAYTDDNTATISIGQAVATTDDVEFNSIVATNGLDASIIQSDEVRPLTSDYLTLASPTYKAEIQLGETTGYPDGYLTAVVNSNNWSFISDGRTAFPNYTFPAADGTSNQVLKTSGGGTLSWASDNPFDQSLNTTDYVEFAGVSASIIHADELRPLGPTDTNVRMITIGSGTYQTGKADIVVTESSGYPNGVANIVVNSNQWSFRSDGGTSFPNYAFPSADGSSGQYLVTDGSGFLSWTTPSPSNPFDQDLNTTDDVTFNTVYSTTSLASPTVAASNLVPMIDSIGMTTTGGTLTGKASMSVNEDITFPNGRAHIEVNAYAWDFNSDGTTSFPNYTFPVADGTAGQSLVTDGTGTLSWATGGNPFNQDLNTFDSVTFSSVQVNGGSGSFTTAVGVNVELASPNISVGDAGATPTNGFTVNGGIGHAAYIYLDNSDDSLNFGVNSISSLWKFNEDLSTQFPNYKFPAADGTNGQVPTTNGSGVITWQTPSGGSSTTDFTPSFLLGGM